MKAQGKLGLKEAFAIIKRAQKKACGKKCAVKATMDEDKDLDAFLANLQQNMNLSDDEKLSTEQDNGSSFNLIGNLVDSSTPSGFSCEYLYVFGQKERPTEKH